MENKYSLTYPQKNIWMVEEFFGKSSMNTIVGLFRVNRGFNLDLCEKAVNKMVELNDALRLRIYKDSETGEVYQKITEYSYFKVDFFDLAKLGKTEKELNDELTLTPFETIDNPLHYFAIVKTGDSTGYILVKLHHLVADAWTFSNVANELSMFIEHMENVETLPSYLEYIAAEKEYVLSERFVKDKAFWEEYLNGLNECVKLKDIESSLSNEAKRYSVQMDNELNEKLKNYCKVNRVSPYTVFMTALAIYIHRVTEKNDFVIGTPVLNRSNAKEKKMMGMFVSTMPVRFKIDEDTTFYNMCKACAAESMSLFRHQKYPYSLIQKDFKEKNDLKDNLYSVMLSYQNARFESESEDKTKYTTNWVFSGKIQNELELHIMDMDETGVLQVHFDYRVAAFEDEEIKYFAKRIFEIIKDGIENDSKVKDIKIMSDEERNKILNEFNNTARPYPNTKTVIDVFEEIVEKYPKKTALTFETEEMTYERLNELAESLASYLSNLGVKESDCVAISVDKSFELLVSIIAVLKLGAYYLPLELTQTKEKKDYMVKDTNCVIAITDNDETYDNIKSVNVKEIDFSSIEKTKYKRSTNYTAISPVCVLYTSGTTGNPKGALVINKNITKLVLNPDYIEFKDTDTVLQAASTNFDVSLFEFWGPLLNGGTCALLKKQNLLDSNYLNKYVKERGVTIAWITQALFSQIIDNKIEVFETLRAVFSGGDVMSLKHVNKLRETYKDLQIINCYGPTECVTFTNTFDIKSTRSVRVPLGKAISNTYGYVIDSKFRLLPLYTEGEYVIGGDSVALGYINNPDLTKEKFVEDKLTHKGTMYKTGDVVRMLEDGIIDFVGRRDNQVKIRGYRIELDEIKNVILSMPNVKDSVVIIRENNGAKRIYAYYVATIELSEKEVIEYIKERLAKHMVPYGAMQLDRLPLNANGKVDRKNLPEIVKNIDIVERDLTENETKLLEIVSEVIQDKIGVNTNLFDVGIDSLSVLSIATSISNKFGKTITPQQIFANPTIERIAALIEESAIKEEQQISEEENAIKISSVQKNIFMQYVNDTESVLYNIPFEIKFNREEINIVRLKEAIEEVINSSPSLFAYAGVTDGDVEIKLTSRNAYVKTEIIDDIEFEEIKKNFVKPFDLLAAPLFRVNMYVTDKYVYVLLDFHHMIIDGLSIQNLFNNISYYYENGNLRENNKAKFRQEKNDYETAKKYYLDMFSGELNVNDFVLDKKRSKTRTYIGDSFLIDVPKEVYEKLNKYAASKKVTINNVCLAAFNILLCKYMYSEDIITGVTTSGRSDMSMLDEIGNFVKILPFRSKIIYDLKIDEYVKNIQSDLNKCIENDIYTVDNLIKDLNIKRVPGRNALFDTLYTYQGFNMNSVKVGDKVGTINRIPTNTSKYDVNFEVINDREKISLNVEYCSSIFNKTTIMQFTMHYINILNNIVQNQDGYLKDIDMISLEEKDKIINVFNDTSRDYPRDLNVAKAFEQIAKQYPEKIAVKYMEDELTYCELNKRANIIARNILEKGIKKGSIVAVMIDKSVEYIASILAVIKAGCVYMPLDDKMPDERVKFILEDSDVTLVLTTNLYDRSEIKQDKIFVDTLAAECDVSDIDVSILPTDAAYVIYTSGSTGNPKGVKIPHKGVLRLVCNSDLVYFDNKDVMLVSGSLTFDSTVFEIWGALLNGLTLHLTPREIILNPNQYKEYILDNNVTVTVLPTPIFNKLVEYDPTMFRNMKQICVGGESVYGYYTNKVREKCPNVKIVDVYGPTENSVICSAMLVDKEYNEEVPIGKVTSNSECYVLDKCDKLCPPKVPGELYVGGEGLAIGYINREKLNKESFYVVKELEKRMYKTGDIAVWTTDGVLEFMGRRDFQVKIRGQRIEIAEIENKILEIAKVKQCTVMALDNAYGTKYLVAFCTLEKEISEEIIEKHLANVLPKYMIPSKFIFLDAMPLNQNEKVDRNKLKEIAASETHKSAEKLIKPTNKKQEIILDLFKNVLEIEELSMTDDFFELGGDSLLAMNLVAQASNEGINLNYSQIFDYPTPLELYNEIYKEAKEAKEDVFDISDYDYTKIDEVISKTSGNTNINNEKQAILLTGAAGFLGSHILAELLDNTSRDVYCLIRKKDNMESSVRLRERLEFFFGNKYNNFIGNRIKVLEGDLTFEQICVNNDDMKLLKDNVGIVINSAAFVKHYGKREIFESINVHGVNNLIKLCIENDIKLVHISTLSVSGNMLESGQVEQTNIKENIIYDENKFYIGQKFDNIYVYTKFIAERNILENVIKNNLKATIIRVGNLTGREKDGKFQPNVEENAFANRIKAFINLKTIGENMKNMDVEFTAIDLAAEAICKLVLTPVSDRIIYHVYNNNHIKMDSIIEIIKMLGINIDFINDEEEMKKINSKIKIGATDEIQGVLPDVKKGKVLKYSSNIKISNANTLKALEELGFSWPNIDDEYIINYFNYLIKIKFI